MPQYLGPLFSTSLFPLFFLKASHIVTHKLISIQRNFLWGGEEDRMKIVWVSWNQICCPQNHGGLGVKDIRLFNNALLGKWRRDLLEGRGNLWCD